MRKTRRVGRVPASLVLAIFFLASCAKGLTTPPVSPTTAIPSVYYAAFARTFDPGHWQQGRSYDYQLALAECASASFVGPIVAFDVTSDVFAPPFFLLKDGIYDNPDKNIASLVNASSSQRSYAVVIIPRVQWLEAQAILDTCNAFIAVNAGPPIELDPYREGPIPGFGPAGSFEIDVTNLIVP